MVTTSSIISHADVARFADGRVNLKRDVVAAHREQAQRVREKVEGFIQEHPEYGLIKILLSGSLAKGTALSDLNDIDLAVYVKSGIAPVDEKDLLDWLAEKLRAAYPQKDPDDFQPQTHVVKIHFRGSGLDVDVAPVHYDGLPEDRGYLVDRTNGRRVLTSIPLHLKFIRARKAKQPTHYAQVIRLVKWWVKQRKADDENFRCKSFLTEMLCAHLADNGHDMSDYPTALEDHFTYIVKSQLKETIAFSDYYKPSSVSGGETDAIRVFDPVNSENNVGAGYDEADRKRLVAAAEQAMDQLAMARYAQTKGEALECWRAVLGPSFMR